MDKLCPLAVFLLFFIPSACFYRFCKKSVLPRWRYALVLLPGSQGAVLAVILSVIQSFPQEGSGARCLFSLLLPVHLLADVLQPEGKKPMDAASFFNGSGKQWVGSQLS